jgi:hypothetical protein
MRIDRYALETFLEIKECGPIIGDWDAVKKLDPTFFNLACDFYGRLNQYLYYHSYYPPEPTELEILNEAIDALTKKDRQQ